MRPLNKVLQAVINQAPEGEERTQLSLYLRSAMESIPYTAPEMMHNRWGEAATSLAAYVKETLHDPNESGWPEWLKTAAKIFRAELSYEDYL